MQRDKNTSQTIVALVR